MALAEVASGRGYKRLVIVGDCGYYALAAEAFAKNLSCWGSQSWVPHPDGAFASFRCPRFWSPSLDLGIILCLGTTQMIASPEPEKNLSTQLGRGTSVVYVTADTRGLYSGEALEKVSAEYEPFLVRPWVTQKWHFNLGGQISMLDIVACVNSLLLTGVEIQNNDDALLDVVEALLEINSGSTAYVVGLFLGHTASQMEVYGETPGQRAWLGSAHLTKLVEDMAQCDGVPHPEDIITEKVSPVFEYLQPILQRISSVTGTATETLTEDVEFHMLAALIGNPMCKGSPPPATYKEFKLAMALRIQDTLLSLLTIGKHTDKSSGLPIGKSYVDFLACFQAKLNRNVLSEVESSHSIDGSKFPLFDCRFVPGFGFNVFKSLTVWTKMSNYHWMSTILLRFSESTLLN